MMYGRALIEHPVPLDLHRNYQSFYEAQQEVEDDLDRVISGKIAELFASLEEELTEFLQDDPKRARLAVIIKTQERQVEESAFGCRHVEKWHERAHLVVRKSCSFRECGTRLNRCWTHWNIDSLHMKPSGTCGYHPKPKTPRHFVEFSVVDFQGCLLHSTLFEKSGLLLWYVVSLDGWCFFFSAAFCLTSEPLL